MGNMARALVCGMRLCVLALVVWSASCGEDGPLDEYAVEVRVSTMLRDLAAEDAVERRDAALALADIWPEGARAVPVLVAALDDEDGGVRDAAARSLAALGDRGVVSLATWLRDAEDPARQAFVHFVSEVMRLGAKGTPKDLAGCMASSPGAGLVLLALFSAMHPRGGDKPFVSSFLSY